MVSHPIVAEAKPGSGFLWLGLQLQKSSNMWNILTKKVCIAGEGGGDMLIDVSPARPLHKQFLSSH